MLSLRQSYFLDRAVVGLVALLAIAHLLVGIARPPSASSSFVVDEISFRVSVSWIIRLGLTGAAALCFLIGPGWIIRRWLSTNSIWNNSALLWMPGFLWLVTVGLLAWLCASFLDPQVTVIVLVLPVPIAILIAVIRPSASQILKRSLFKTGERVVIGLMLLLVLIGIGKATWSSGTEGELYLGTVSRSLEVGNRSDSRIPYNAVSLVSNGETPYGEFGNSLYAPYNFSDRPPMAGLATVGVVLGSGADPPRVTPDQPWEPFDVQGFAAYRVMMIMLGTVVLLGVYGLLRLVVGPRLSLAACSLLALCPFVVHETYFIWPKLLSVAFAVAAIVVLILRRPFVAGLLLGLSFLAHPSGIFWVPTILLIALAFYHSKSYKKFNYKFSSYFRDLLFILFGFLLFYFGWRIANIGHYRNNFSGYIIMANGVTAKSIPQWFDFRWSSLTNSLIPFKAWITDGNSRWTNSINSDSNEFVRFNFMFFSTLPFAVGLIYFPLFIYGLIKFARNFILLFFAAIVIPFIGFIIYWGVTNTGIIRESMHFWFVLVVLAAFLGHSVLPSSRTIQIGVRYSATARAIGVLIMLLMTTLSTTRWIGPSKFAITDLVSLSAMVLGTGGLAWCNWRLFSPGQFNEEVGQKFVSADVNVVSCGYPADN